MLKFFSSQRTLIAASILGFVLIFALGAGYGHRSAVNEEKSFEASMRARGQAAYQAGEEALKKKNGAQYILWTEDTDDTVCLENGDTGEKCFTMREVSNALEGWRDEVGEFTPWACERTTGNNDAYPDGAERYLIATADSIGALARHGEVHLHLDADAAPSWHQPMVKIDYRKQHEVCVSNMPGVYAYSINGKPATNEELAHANLKDLKGLKTKYQGDVTRCFDLYDIGER